MKINQFAQVPTNISNIKEELKSINFYSDETEINQLFIDLMRKEKFSFSDTNVFWYEMDKIIADEKNTLKSFLINNHKLNLNVFYVIALQLLDFQIDVDFEIDKPIESMHKLGLKTINQLNNSQDLLKAWYLLLNTHNKYGLNLIDELASNGYYEKQELTNQLIFFNGKAQATFTTKDFYYETVFVETDLDSDMDGKNDLIKVEITRPKSNLKIPAIYTASPYDQGVNEKLGENLTHDVKKSLIEKPIGKEIINEQENIINNTKNKIPSSISENATLTHSIKPKYSLNDYLLVRGYASVYAAGIGTIDSDGFQTCGDEQQTASTIAVIEWLHGDRIAFTDRINHIQTKANWCNGNVAMTGRSYLGTLAIAAATTGVDGLKTIVPEAAISSWYDYYRENGLVIAPETFPGEDADVLAGETFSRSLVPGDNLKIRSKFDKYLNQMKKQQDRETGNYNQFWDKRNYLNNVNKIKADLLIVHGLNDWNVKPKNPGNLWQMIKNMNINKKIILHQGKHININTFPSFDYSDIINLWFSNKLYDKENNVDNILPTVIWQDNTLSNTWHKLNDWNKNNYETYSLNTTYDSFKNKISNELFDKYSVNYKNWQHDFYDLNNQNLTHNRIISTIELKEDKIINGDIKVNLRIKSSKNIGMLSIALLDNGDANRLKEFPTPIAPNGYKLGYKWYNDTLREFEINSKITSNKLITKAHINLQNRTAPNISEEIIPNEYYDVKVKLNPTIYKIPANRSLSLIIYSVDYEMTINNNDDIKYTIDLNNSTIKIPFE
ncbi:Xaa-Pro dipeptidyl-peptidase [Lactobacillus sp. S2-2]|uniref:Xaa-Pro dipeptidyl-peptidase n=1 Tax=Lactobacillus sp. S2-2 TaxID=2692917 RepID=UPI001F0174C8|nr:Xaa-Pro dipeptidyl-peptidase [Lactobacillus sp. S2-2]MCF6515726.1 Xaa-Pro dipeptidyl-peptidase [Lactobacillus sp. S2-2]